MIEKLENKINKEMEKVFVRDDLSLEDLKTLIEIKNGLEMRDILKETMLTNTDVLIPYDLKEGETK